MSPVVERLRVGVSGSFKSFAAAPVSVDFATAISTAFWQNSLHHSLTWQPDKIREKNGKKKGRRNKRVNAGRWRDERKGRQKSSREAEIVKGIQNSLRGEREIRKRCKRKKAGTLSSWVTHCRATAAPSHLWSALHSFHSSAPDTLSNEHSHSHYGSWEAGTDAAAKQAKIYTDAVTR